MMRVLPLLFVLCALASAATGSLDVYFIDVEEGSSILFVAPAGESMLVDAGSKGNGGRDVERVLSVLKQAGVSKIDYLVVTHYHNDHYGAVPELARRVPVANFVDHGPSVETAKTKEWQKHWELGTDDALYNEYVEARSRGRYLVVKPGDTIPVKGINVRTVTAAGQGITTPLPGGGAANPYCAVTPLRSEDETEDGQSVGILVTFGGFRLAFLGDVTWNKLRRLFCPNNPVGTVDVYVTSHHAMSVDRETGGEVRWGRSGTPEAEVHALRPRVAILNYGERYHRVGTPRGWRIIRNSPGLEDFWQVHYQTGGGPENNVPESFIANLSAKECAGHWLRVSARRDGSFTVANSRTGFSKNYEKTAGR